MSFHTLEKKGINRFIVSEAVTGDKLSLHISVVPPGQRAHPPHAHGGVEAFYMLEGEGTLEQDGERQRLGPNEAIVIEGNKEHGLVNTGSVPMRYMVIISR